MPLHETDALILKTYKLGEADRIVVFLSRDRGKKRGVAKGARRTRSRFQGALEPLTLVHLVYFERERRELVGLNFAETLASPLSAHNPDAFAHVGYFAELMDEWAQENDANEPLFRLGAAVVDALARDIPLEPLARYFEYWLLRLQGVYPPLTRCQYCQGGFAGGARLALESRVLVCGRCQPGGRSTALSDDALTFLRALGAVAPLRLPDVPVSGAAMREVERVHRALIASHLEKDLRSQRVLREMRTTSAPPR
ncbi:MAG: DNA repair protein RecO [Vicinamibacterales bacterium]